MATPFTGLNRLLNSLRSQHHDFKPTTELFPQLDVEKIAADLQLAEIGESRGKENLPPTNSNSFDDVELKIIERVDEAKTTAFNNLEDELHHFSVRLSNLDFQGQFNQIQRLAGESLTDFMGEVVKGRNELHTLRRNLNVADKDLANFQKKNKLDRAAVAPKTAWQAARWLLLIALFLIELAVNAGFLAQGSRSGFVGGVIEAFAFSFINVFGTALITLFGIRHLTNVSYFWKFVGFVFLTAYVAIALVVNLVLAHFREIAGNLFDGAGYEALTRVWENPFGLGDLMSWMLFAVGFICSVVTAIDVWYMGDPYMGYHAVHKRREEAEEEYKEQQAFLIDLLIQRRDQHHEQVDQVIDELKKRRRDHADVIAHRAKVLALFKEHQAHLERAANQLIRRYRDANIAARSTPAPKYFATNLKMERLKPTYSKENEVSEKEITDALKKAQEELSAQIQAISKACEDGIKEYRELDNLFPEETNGQA